MEYIIAAVFPVSGFRQSYSANTIFSSSSSVLLGLLLLDANGAVVLPKVLRVLLVRRLLEEGLLPQVRGQVGVGLADGGVGGLGEISKCAGGSLGGGVAILDAGHLQQLLGHGGGHDARSARRGDEPHPDGAALASHLSRHGMRLAELVAPEAPPHRHDGQLGEDDGTPDGGSDLLGALDAKSHVAVVVADGDEGLEAGALTGAGLLLHGHDLQHVVLEGGPQEEVDDLELLNGEREEVDLLERLDLAVLDETAELGHRDPFLLLLAAPAATSAAAVSAPAAVPAAAAATAPTETASESTTIGWSSVRHSDLHLFR